MISESMGFKWFFGVVEDRDDPKKMGRVRVRAHNIYSSNKTELPTNKLPWATVVMPATSAGVKEVGSAPVGIMVGATVFGFFADGEDCQMPMVLGTLAGIAGGEHEVGQLARGINNVSVARYPDSAEPPDPYAAKYPYNKVTTTESGHALELDDTPNHERIRLLHKSGSYIQVDKEGTRTDKTVGDKYEIIRGDDWIEVRGDVMIIVNGNADVNVKGKAQVSVDGETRAAFFGKVDVTTTADITLGNPSGNVKVTALNLDLYGVGGVSVEAGGALTLRGSVINMQGTVGGVIMLNPQADFLVTARNIVTTSLATTTFNAGTLLTIDTAGALTLGGGGAVSVAAAGALSMAGTAVTTVAGAAYTVTSVGALSLTSSGGAASLHGTNGTAVMAP